MFQNQYFDILENINILFQFKIVKMKSQYKCEINFTFMLTYAFFMLKLENEI